MKTTTENRTKANEAESKLRTKLKSREVHRRGMVKISYDNLEAMRPVVAALERSGWDIRYKVDDIRQVKEIWLESEMFDESEEYREYRLESDGRVWRADRESTGL